MPNKAANRNNHLAANHHSDCAAKFGKKDDSGHPLHSPSQTRMLARHFAGKEDKLNEGLAAKYQKSLADLSDSDAAGSDADALCML